MSDIALDADGDVDVVNNSIYLNDGLEAIRQHMQIRFQLFLGEWFLDEEAGVPWFRDVLIKNPSFVVVQEILKTVVLDTPGVIELLAFDFSYDAKVREANLSFQALTTDGFIDFNQIVEVSNG